jgi:hypothetical protein
MSQDFFTLYQKNSFGCDFHLQPGFPMLLRYESVYQYGSVERYHAVAISTVYIHYLQPLSLYISSACAEDAPLL